MRKKTRTIVKKTRRTAADEFPARLREMLLLWCARHCCLCGKQCDVLIDIHHIKPVHDGGTSDEDNAIPLCFDCHGKVGHYSALHPKGNRFREDELKKRRDQVYDQHTRNLIPPLQYKVHSELGRTQKTLKDGKTVVELSLRKLPDAGFRIAHPGQAPPVRVLVKLDTYINGRAAPPRSDALYGGKQLWNLNPGEGVEGHFEVAGRAERARDVRVVVNLTMFDIYERPHVLLPITWVFNPIDARAGVGTWWLDPVGPEVIQARVRERARPGRKVK
jgi:hypothetical protein